jgi:DNA polymerase-3 subunit delta
MRLNPDQLIAHLKKPLQKVYLISGDEPMQLLEAADEIRQAAKANGIEDREVIFADAKFSWDSLLEQGGTMSLFAEQRMLDLRIEKFPIRNAHKTFLEFLQNVDDSLVVLITAPKLDAKMQKQKWASLISEQYVWMPVWPITIDALPQWLVKKAIQKNRQLPIDAAKFLADQVEGNLLAAKQELEKACLLTSDGESIDQDLLQQQVSDNARFTPWELLDATFNGGTIEQLQKIPRILQRLKQEKVEPMLLAKSLQRDCLTLEKMSAAIENGKPQAAVLQEYRIWGPKQAIMNAALRRYRSNAWQRLWVRSMSLEKVIVAQKQGDFWDECLELCLLIAAVPIWSNPKKVNKKTNKNPTNNRSNGAEIARQALRNSSNTNQTSDHRDSHGRN